MMRRNGLLVGACGLWLLAGFGAWSCAVDEGRTRQRNADTAPSEQQLVACTRPPLPTVPGGPGSIELTPGEYARVRAADCEPDPGKRLAALQRAVADVMGSRKRGGERATNLSQLEESLIWQRVGQEAYAALADKAHRLSATAADIELDRQADLARRASAVTP